MALKQSRNTTELVRRSDRGTKQNTHAALLDVGQETSEVGVGDLELEPLVGQRLKQVLRTMPGLAQKDDIQMGLRDVRSSSSNGAGERAGQGPELGLRPRA